MRILSVGPPLYGLLYPVLSLVQVFRANGHEILITSEGQFAQKTTEVGSVVSDAAPGLDSEAGYRHHKTQRKKNNIGTQMGNFSFFSEEMADHLMEFAGHRRPDLIIYPPLGVIGLLIAARHDIPVVMQAVDFSYTLWHIRGITRSFADTYCHRNVGATPHDVAWINVTPPSVSILKNDGEPIIPMRHVPYSGGVVWEPRWERRPDHKHLLMSPDTVKPMVDSLDLIAWVMNSASEADAEIILYISVNAQSDLRSPLSNVRPVDRIPMGVFLDGADGLIHHDEAGNTLIAPYTGIPQIILGQGTDRLINIRAVVEHGYGIIPDDIGLSSSMINVFPNNRSLRKAPEEVAAEVAAQPCLGEVVRSLIAMMQRGQPLHPHDNHLPAPIQEPYIHNNAKPERAGFFAE